GSGSPAAVRCRPSRKRSSDSFRECPHPAVQRACRGRVMGFRRIAGFGRIEQGISGIRPPAEHRVTRVQRVTASPSAVRRVRDLVRAATSGEAPPAALAGTTDADLVAAVARHRVAEVLLPAADLVGLPGPVVTALTAIVASGRRAASVQVLETVRLAALLSG